MVVGIEDGRIVGGKFAKFFLDDISKLFSLTGSERALLDLMIRDSVIGVNNTIQMNPARKKKYAGEIGLKTYRTISNMINSMILKNILKDLRTEDVPHKIQINPEILFKGNDYQRAKIIVEYSDGERNVKAFRNAEEAERYFALEPTTN